MAGSPETPAFGGLVLAGGRSSRMGTDKAFLEIDGRPLVERVRESLSGAGAAPLVAVGGDAEALDAAGFVPVPDRWPGQGPLGGLITGLAWLSTETAVVLSCDLPFADTSTVRALVSALASSPRVDGVIPVVEGRRQPLFAAYRSSAGEALANRFEHGERSVLDAVATLRLGELRGLSPQAFSDVDSPEEVARIRSQLASRPVDIPQIDVSHLAEEHAAGAPVLDVRNADEYEAGHVPGARLIPLSELAGRVAEVPTGEPLYVICAVGARSQKACELLVPHGYEVSNVAGGTKAWIGAGRPVVTGSDPG